MILIYLIFLINIKLYFSLEFIKDSDLKKKKYEESNIKLKQPYTQDSEVKYLKPSEDHRTSDLSNKKLYQFKIEIENTNKKYCIFKTKTKKYEEYCRLELLLNYNTAATAENYVFASNLYLHNNIAVDVKEHKTFYISVNAPISNCDGDMEYYLSDDIDLDPNDHFEFIGRGMKNPYYITIKKFYWSMLELLLLSPQREFYNFHIGYYKKNDQGENEFVSEESCFPNYLIKVEDFFTDCSYILKLSKVVNYEKIVIELSGENNTFMRFSTRKIDDPIYRIGEPAFYSIKAKETEIIQQEECVLLENVKSDRQYQLRVINTYSLQMTIKNYLINFDYLSNHYQIFKEGELNNHDFICFKSLPKTNKTDKNGKVKVVDTDRQAFYFQIIEQNPEYSIYSVLEPLYEGNRYYDKLPIQGQRFYRPAKKTDLQTYLIIVVKEGMISAKTGKCKNFPNCKLDNDLSNYDQTTVSNLNYAFGAFVTYLDPNNAFTMGDHEQYVTIVQCESNVECLFSIQYSSEEKNFYLEENQNFAKYIAGNKNKTDSYIIFPHSNNKIEVNFDVISGNADIHFQFSNQANPKIEKIRYGNSKKFIINNDGNLESFLAIVDPHLNSYYLISYRYINQQNKVSLKDSGLLLQYLDNDTKEKIFVFKHNLRKADIGIFYINVIPLNCEINVNFENIGQEIKPINYTGIYEYQINDENYFGSQLDFNVKLKSFDNNEKQKKCYFYIGSSESSQTIPYFIRENFPFSVTLSKKNKNAYFVFPYSVYEGNSIIIKVNLEIEALIKISYRINSEKSESFITFKSMSLEIVYNTLQYSCIKKVICSIYLDFILLDNKNTEDINVPISFSINTGRVASSILKKNYLRRESVPNNRISYFSMEVYPYEEGEIILDMKRGSGTIIAKIFDTNSDFNLPKKDDSSLIKFDFENQKLSYGYGNYNNCENCILYLGISSNEKYGNDNNLFFFDFNIYARTIYQDIKDLNKSIVNIYLNEFISGSLTKTIKNNYYDVYSLYIIEELEGIDIEFYSLSTSLYINFNTDEIPNQKNTKCIIPPSGKDQIFKITKNNNNNNCKIDKLLKDKKFLISIGTDIFENGKNSPYVFRVRPIRNNIINIIESNSDKETTCIIEEDNGYCYFLVPINSYDLISELVAYTYSDGMTELSMYAKIINSTTFKECKNLDCLKNYLPNQKNNDKSSEKQFNKNYLIFSDVKLSITDLVIIGVKSTIKEIISFTKTYKTFVNQTSPIPLFLQLIHLESNTKTIEYTNENNYIISLMNIAGTAIASITNDNSEREDYKISNNMMVLFDTKAIKGNIELNSGNTPYLVGIWYNIKRDGISVNELIIGKYTKIYFQHKAPYSFYTLIKNKNEDYIFEFTINGIFMDKSIKESVNLEINSYLVNETTMNKLKLNNNSPLNGLKKINGYFDNERLIGRVYIESKNLDENNFLFTTISINNTIKVNKLSAYLYIYPSRTPFEAVPQEIYISGTIVGVKSSKFLLKKNAEKEGKNFIVEICLSIQEDLFEFVDKNNNIINKKIIQSVGKKIFNIETEEDYIYLVIGKNNSYNKFDYSFKYVSGKLAITERKNSLSSDKIQLETINKNNNEIKLTINGIMHKGSNEYINFTYFFKIYDLDKNQNLENTYKMSTNAVLLKESFISKSIKSNNTKITQTFTNIPNKALIYVFAVEDMSKEFFGYESIKYPLQEKNQKNVRKISTIIIIIFIIIAISIIIAVTFKFKKMIVERDTLKEKINQLSVTISGTSIPEAQENLLGKNNY